MRTYGTGTVRQRGDNRFEVRFIAAGKRHSHTITAGDADEAARRLNGMIAALNEAPEAALGSYTLRTWLAEWQRRHARSRSRKAHAQRVRCYLDTAPFADDLLVNLRERDVRDHVRRLVEDLAPSTVRATLALLRSALEEARVDELIRTNPAKDVRLPKDTPEREEVRAPLSKNDLLRLFAARLPVVDKAIIGIGGVSGLRAGELFALPLAAVRDDKGLLLVTVAVGGFGGAPTKNGETRIVPVIGEAAHWLRAWLATVPRDLRRNSERLLFPGRGGGRRSLSHASSWLGKRLVAAGIRTEHRFHDLRHTAAGAWLNGWWTEPLPPAQVQAIMGHASVAQTEHYTGTAAEAMLASVRGHLEQIRGSQPEAPSESLVLQAKSEPTGRRTPCLSALPEIPQACEAPSPDLRQMTVALLEDIATGRVTGEDIENWRDAVLAEMPEPWRGVVGLAEARSPVRAAAAAAGGVLGWLDNHAREPRRKDGWGWRRRHSTRPRHSPRFRR